jgi:nitrogen fixation/metabolism regulation signal transduction histidine kinase
VRLSHDRRITLLALGAGLPAVVLSMVYLGDLPARVSVPLGALVLGSWLGLSWALQRRVVRPLATLSNLLAGVREGDFSVRAAGARGEDALGLTLLEINALADALREQRLGAREAAALLETVMDAIDVAVFAFDLRNELQLANAAGERVLGKRAGQLLGSSAESLGLEECFGGASSRTIELRSGGAPTRWELRRSVFRQGGDPMTLLVLSDPGRILREQERQAWRRLIRVLSHEINNSLAPISSITDALQRLMNREADPTDWREDLEDGLGVIGSRAEALARFMDGYARLARLPEPKPETMNLRTCVERVLALETRMKVQIDPERSANLEIEADQDQIEQLLINAIRNAVDASLEAHGGASGEGVRVAWQRGRDELALWVEDDGKGIANPNNLFVPFFSTKAHGSGIGLVLSQQIAEGHGGRLTLSNRQEAEGAVLCLVLPLSPEADEAAKSSAHMSLPRRF